MNVKHTLLIFPLAVLALVSISVGQEASEISPYQDLVARVEDAIRYETQQKGIPSFSIAMIADGKMIYSGGEGFQDAEKTIPATGKSVYRVGSISKLLTDVALMQLVQEGTIDLDAPVQTYLPDFKIADPEHSRKITLRQLTQHRAGIVREPPVGHYFDPDEPGLEATVASLAKTGPVYLPDSKTKYSNAGVSVVGAAVAKMAGTDHPAFLRRGVLEPLGMNQASFVKTSAVEGQLAAGWMWGYDRPAFPAPDFLLGTGPAGNLYASMEDLAQFSLFVMGQHEHPVLEDAALQEMLTPGVTPEGKNLPYGIGFRINDFRGHRKVGHGGAVYGYSTQIEILPDQKVAVAAASSLDGTNSLVTRICEFALDGLLAIKNNQELPEYEKTTTVDGPRARVLAGTFSNGNQAADQRVVVDWMGDRVLMWQGTFQREIRSRERDGQLVVDDLFGYGTPVSLAGDVLKIGETEFKRLPDQPPAGCKPAWQPLIGEYGWDHNTLYILERHGQVCALIEWFYYYPLTEVATDRFAFPDYGLYHGEEIQFHRNEAGQVEAATAAEVYFERREVGTKEGETFKIKRELPVDVLRKLANEAQPPKEIGTFKPSELVELTEVEPGIQLDIRYATTNNFMDTVFYQQPRAFAQRPAAAAAAQVHQSLKERGLGLLIHDAYRPWRVTKMFWDATPDAMKDFVANPAKGSRHNRGCALDLTLFDLDSEQPIPMVSGYDEFSQRSYPLYPGGTQRQRWYRSLLRRSMESAGFTVYEFEWWHFDFNGWENYRIGNQVFEEISP